MPAGRTPAATQRAGLFEGEPGWSRRTRRYRERDVRASACRRGSQRLTIVADKSRTEGQLEPGTLQQILMRGQHGVGISHVGPRGVTIWQLLLGKMAMRLVTLELPNEAGLVLVNAELVRNIRTSGFYESKAVTNIVFDKDDNINVIGSLAVVSRIIGIKADE